MQSDAINPLHLALNEFEVVLDGSAPAVRNALRPGLTDEAIDALSASLLPFVLPYDLRALYRWHNGQYPYSPGPHMPLFHDADFLPLEAAVESYNVWIQVHLNWNPLWFPAFGARSGLLVTLSQDTSALAGELWAFDGENTEISTAYDSILGLVRTATAAWREADHIEPDFLGPDADMRRAHNPSSIRPDGAPRLTVSMLETGDWPDDWIEAAAGARRVRGPEHGRLVPDHDRTTRVPSSAPSDSDPRQTVRAVLDRLIGKVDALRVAAAGRAGSSEAIAHLAEGLSVELPSAVHEFLLVAGGPDSDICELLQQGETRSTIAQLARDGLMLRRAAIEMGADPERARMAIPLTSTAEAVTLVDAEGPDPAVWYVLEDGESGELASSFTVWLAASVDLATENRRAGFGPGPPPRTLPDVEAMLTDPSPEVLEVQRRIRRYVDEHPPEAQE